MGKKWMTAVVAAALSVVMASSAFAGTWENQEGRWKYHNDDGSYAAAQWVEDQGTWYYVEQDGFMKTGWFQDGAGVWYYFDENTGPWFLAQPGISGEPIIRLTVPERGYSRRYG